MNGFDRVNDWYSPIIIYGKLRTPSHLRLLILIIEITHWINRIVLETLLVEHPIAILCELLHEKPSQPVVPCSQLLVRQVDLVAGLSAAERLLGPNLTLRRSLGKDGDVRGLSGSGDHRCRSAGVRPGGRKEDGCGADVCPAVECGEEVLGSAGQSSLEKEDELISIIAIASYEAEGLLS